MFGCQILADDMMVFVIHEDLCRSHVFARCMLFAGMHSVL
jgi:hypothetical protein